MAVAGLALVSLLISGHPGVPTPHAVGHDSTDSPLIFEYLERTVRYEADGTGHVTLAGRILVRTEAAVRMLGELTFPYDSATERLDIDTVRVLKSGGGVVVAPPSAVQDVTAPIGREAPMYSDLREKIITVPGLRPGDTLVYHITWVEQNPVTPGEFWYVMPFLRTAVVRDERFSVDVPREKDVLVKTEGGPAPEVKDSLDRRVYRWRLANPTIDTTGASGRRAMLAHSIQLTTFHSWADVGRWYAGLEREREAVTPAVQAKAADLVRGRTTLRDSLTALYEFVSQNFRYVSLSFGVGRYQPHPAADVLVNDYGDCKDKHVLLAALFHAIGVASAPALISSEGDIDSTVPSPSQFDHLITFVPVGSDTIWLDATPGLSPFGLLLYPLRDHTALVVPQTGIPRLMRTPDAAPVPSFEHMTLSGAISDGGSVALALRYSMRGDEEVVVREVVRDLPQDRLVVFASKLLEESQLSGSASAVDAGDPTRMRDPYSFGFRVDQNTALSWQDHRATYALPLPQLDLPPAFDSTNRHDTLALALIAERTRQLSLVLPAGTKAELPVPVSLKRDYAAYTSSYAMHGDTLTAERSLRFTRPRLTAERSADWNSFRRAVRDDESQNVTLIRSSSAPVAGGPAAGGDADQLHSAALDALNAGDAVTAVTLFRRVVVLQPRHEYAWNNLGRAYMRLNQLDSALAAFQKQIDINPYDQYAYNNVGLIQWRRGDLHAAAGSFGKQIEVNPLDKYAHANLGRVDLALDADSDAVHELSRAAVITPEDGPVRADLGRAWLRLHQPDSAVAEFDRAVELAPTATTWNTVAYALALSGERLDRAATYARSAIDATAATLRTVMPDHIGPRELLAVAQLGAYWDTLGWIEFRRGNIAAAEPYVRAAWLLLHHTEVGDHLGQIYAAQGRKIDAMRAYAMALDGMVPLGLADTRRRLEAIVGSAAAAKFWTDSGRIWMSQQRTVSLGTIKGLEGIGRVQLIVNSHLVIEQVRLLGAPVEFSKLIAPIKAATLPIAFPDSTQTKLPLLAVVTCSGSCTLVLEGGSNFVLSDEAQQRLPH